MILFDLGEFFNDANEKISSFIEQNQTNPIFWSLLLILIFAIACWAISYLNKNKG